MNPLLNDINQEFENAGIEDAQLVRESYSPESFGNAEVVYKIKNLIIKVVRDRGQDIVCMSSKTRPEEFYPFCDISVLMGWQSMEEMVTALEPPSLNSVFNNMASAMAGLSSAFSTLNLMDTRSKLLEIERCRVKALFG